MQADHPVKKILREKIAETIKSWNVSQKEAGKRLGLSQARVSQILSGNGMMSIEKLLDIAKDAGLVVDLSFAG